jgi:hypothetical protein
MKLLLTTLIIILYSCKQPSKQESKLTVLTKISFLSDIDKIDDALTVEHFKFIETGISNDTGRFYASKIYALATENFDVGTYDSFCLKIRDEALLRALYKALNGAYGNNGNIKKGLFLTNYQDFYRNINNSICYYWQYVKDIKKDSLNEILFVFKLNGKFIIHYETENNEVFHELKDECASLKSIHSNESKWENSEFEKTYYSASSRFTFKIFNPPGLYWANLKNKKYSVEISSL